MNAVLLRYIQNLAMQHLRIPSAIRYDLPCIGKRHPGIKRGEYQQLNASFPTNAVHRHKHGLKPLPRDTGITALFSFQDHLSPIHLWIGEPKIPSIARRYRAPDGPAKYQHPRKNEGTIHHAPDVRSQGRAFNLGKWRRDGIPRPV